METSYDRMNIFGPHVKMCLCKRCCIARELYYKKGDEERAAKEALFTDEQKEKLSEIARRILDEIMSEPCKEEIPNPAQNLHIGERVQHFSNSLSNRRTGTIVDVILEDFSEPRFEIVLDPNIDYESETIWSSNGKYGWLERI